MGISLQTNIASIDAQRNLTHTQSALDTALQRLSSGFRINKAADDAAGMAISDRMLAQVQGLNQAVRNANDAISMVQTAEGAYNEQTSMLQRMRELAVEAANGSLSNTDRANIASEIVQLQSQFNNIASATKFNGQQLLTGSLTGSVNTTAGGLQQSTLLAHNAYVTAIDATGAKASTSYDFTSGSGVVTLTEHGTTNSQIVSISAIASGGSETLNFNNLGVSITLHNGTSSSIAASNISADLVGKSDVITAAGSSATFQVGADNAVNNRARLSVAASNLSGSGTSGENSVATDIAAFNSSHALTDAQTLLGHIDEALADIDSQRSTLGAFQNRMEHAMANLQINSENLAAANSRIRDVDVSAETANMSKSTVLMQAGISVLAQANQLPQLALKLLA